MILPIRFKIKVRIIEMIIDVVIGKKNVKLSFFINMSPGNFFSLKSKIFKSSDEMSKNMVPTKINIAPVNIINFAVDLKNSSTASWWVRRDSNPRPVD